MISRLLFLLLGCEHLFVLGAGISVNDGREVSADVGRGATLWESAAHLVRRRRVTASNKFATQHLRADIRDDL